LHHVPTNSPGTVGGGGSSKSESAVRMPPGSFWLSRRPCLQSGCCRGALVPFGPASLLREAKFASPVSMLQLERNMAAIVQWQNACLWHRMSWVRSPLAAPNVRQYLSLIYPSQRAVALKFSPESMAGENLMALQLCQDFKARYSRRTPERHVRVVRKTTPGVVTHPVLFNRCQKRAPGCSGW